jgi:hypothetical protein
MKICPNCRRTYEDDGLNFCLEDGALLNFVSNEAAPTVVMNEGRPTDPMPGGSRSQMGTGQPAYPLPSRSRPSKTWPWVVGIFALIILVCGGGGAGLFLYIASKADTANATKGPGNSPAAKNTNTFTRGAPSPSGGETKEVELADWVEEPTVWLETEFVDGEFHMTSKQKGYYYVLVAKNEDYADASIARVTLRNASDQSSDLGYGLVFHSATTPLTNDYAFLIDTKRKKFRVVRHENEEEKTVTAWTNSNLIRSGAESNTLEARDKGEKIELYINGQLATTITNKQGAKRGVPGLYVGDGAKIGFRKLEVVK